MKNQIFLVALISVLITNVCAQKLAIPVSENGKWGAIDETGNYIIPPEYAYLKDFHNGVAMVKIVATWHYINLDGVIISKNKGYECQYIFSEGLARVYESGKWGFIDTTGDYVIQPQFISARNFNDGLAAVETKTGWGYIDHSGTFVIQPTLKYAHDFGCGIAIVITKSEKEYMNKRGETLPNYDGYSVYHGFKDHYAPVKKVNVWGFIDTTGKYIAIPQFEYKDRFVNGLAPVKRDGGCGYINGKGEEVVPLIYKVSKRYMDNMALVGLGSSLYFLDVETNKLIGKDQPYKINKYFSEGLARVEMKGKFGFINKEGNIVIDCIYDDAKYFSGGVAAVKIGALWGFIDKSGKMIIQPRFDNIRLASKIGGGEDGNGEEEEETPE